RSFHLQPVRSVPGAFLGPVILFLVMSRRQGSDLYRMYVICFAVLGVPALLTLLALFVARQRFPRPEKMDVSVDAGGRMMMIKSFLLYMAAISFLAVGFADFPLITMHIARQNMIPTSSLPLLYAAAMIADAFSALFFGWLYDRKDIRVLMLSSALSAAFTVFIFAMNSVPAMMTGIILWGIGMGAQESVLKSAVATLVPRDSRSTGFGVVETAFGVCWFLGSWLMGALYDRAPVWLVVFSLSMQLLAIPLLYASWRRQQKELTEPLVPR
ncbi:MAG TPA: MFS transporter, partial [Clostridiaceae bacterium]|nr:MFS transporter [Clostridiaceae bacterium]